MPEGEHLRIERIAHEIHPGASDVRVIPDLFGRIAIGNHFFQRGVVPQVRVIEDHRHRLEVPPARSLAKTLHEFRQRVRALRDHAAACFGVSRAGGQSGYAESYGAEAEKRIPSSSINRHSILLWDTRELANSRIPRDNSVSVSSRGRSNAEGAGDQRNVAIKPIRNADWNCDMHSNYPQPAENPPSAGQPFQPDKDKP